LLSRGWPSSVNESQFQSTSHADGDVSIEEVDPEGKFIKLKNNGSDDVPIGAWVIKDVGGDKEVMFKFHSRQVIKAGRNITVRVNYNLTITSHPIL